MLHPLRHDLVNVDSLHLRQSSYVAELGVDEPLRLPADVVLDDQFSLHGLQLRAQLVADPVPVRRLQIVAQTLERALRDAGRVTLQQLQIAHHSTEVAHVALLPARTDAEHLL